ncbi:nuclear transport factor 2 family protein [Chryseobacterium lactis]|uniref:Nuclear transport factor 2 family protein n=1 Tax=Chryseobacterium lactis TaxID=1241981 RepID=A0A3G6RNX5_CHRLC|nr:nuclear transport factor 2 family protein [Chryseobacterium lactis]AZA84339.1 nuclear transport factor 2 family protein [Chryseobacterium lactis]AZB04727.1 nuclear transport factor 2 family protein [Chryseobacterium lactis]PNW14458.1 nuclear transport factor 2 family protein [Chryseobacterium lactis]
MKKIILIRFFLLAICFVSGSKYHSQSKTYEPVSKELYNTIIKKDSLLFSAANAGDISTLKTFFTKDLEFFHDVGGLAGYDETIDNFARVAKNYGYTRRILVPNSVEVYPIKDYGAIQTGLHQFCRLENKELINCGTFKFVHIWKQTPDGWKISRVVSYGH